MAFAAKWIVSTRIPEGSTVVLTRPDGTTFDVLGSPAGN